MGSSDLSSYYRRTCWSYCLKQSESYIVNFFLALEPLNFFNVGSVLFVVLFISLIRISFSGGNKDFALANN